MQVSSKILKTKSSFGRSKRELTFLDDVLMGTYIVDMGTIIAGTKASKTIIIKNIGKNLISFDLDA